MSNEVTRFICGPQSQVCKCDCPNGSCEHKWDGPEIVFDVGFGG